jgi:hypothetical protein
MKGTPERVSRTSNAENQFCTSGLKFSESFMEAGLSRESDNKILICWPGFRVLDGDTQATACLGAALQRR